MTPQFNDTAKEEVRLRADITAVVGRYVKLRPSGQTMKGLCPFHKEKTPSFHVNPERGYFHCFGCGKGGDVFTFLQEIEGVTFPEALRMLAEETGVKLDTPSAIDRPAGGDDTPALSKTEMLDINSRAASFFYAAIRQHPQAVDYFKSRGLLAETVRDFRLGYAPPGWSSILNYAQEQGIPADAVVGCGLAIRKEDGNAYDRFRDRVMFTLIDLSGRVIGFAGRGMTADATPKYLNSPETALYRKKEFLYGLNATRHAIKEQGSALVVEGYMDFLTLFQAGICNVVATSGTAMTPEHGHLLRRFTTRVVLVFDGDEAGQNAAMRGVFTLAPLDLDVSVLTLPPDEDPDSFVKKQGAEPFRALCAKARPGSDFLIERCVATRGNATPTEQRTVIADCAPYFRALTNPVACNRFRRDLADALLVDEPTVDKLLRAPAPVTPESSSAAASTDLRRNAAFMESLEGRFLHLLVQKPELIPQVRPYITADTFTTRDAAGLFSLVTGYYDERNTLDGIIDAAPAQGGGTRELLSFMLFKPALDTGLHEEMVQKIIRLRWKFLKNRIRTTRIGLKSETDAARRRELTVMLNDYTKQLHDLDERE